MADVATLLAEAKTAYHRLVTGSQVVQISDQNGESVRYTRANVDKLQAYIKDLERQVSTPTLGSNGPLRIVI